VTFIDRIARRPERLSSPLPCPGCRASIVIPAETFHLDVYKIHRCSACGSLVTSPLPSAETLTAHYATYNETYTAGMGEERYRREMPKRWSARLDVIERLGGSGRLLDLAGSNGMFGSIAHERGFRVDVADFITEPKDLGFATAQPANFNEHGGVPFPDAAFDVVTLWSCIEHVSDPETCLAETHRLVRPGGLLAIDTPLVADLCERLFAARSHWIVPPEHLHVFSATGLALAVERAGFEVVFAAPFFERSVARWIARRGRNMAVAARGLLTRAIAGDRWARERDSAVTQAGDIQLLVARKP
jgi:SAM-dependent methyltransferase